MNFGGAQTNLCKKILWMSLVSSCSKEGAAEPKWKRHQGVSLGSTSMRYWERCSKRQSVHRARFPGAGMRCRERSPKHRHGNPRALDMRRGGMNPTPTTYDNVQVPRHISIRFRQQLRCTRRLGLLNREGGVVVINKVFSSRKYLKDETSWGQTIFVRRSSWKWREALSCDRRILRVRIIDAWGLRGDHRCEAFGVYGRRYCGGWRIRQHGLGRCRKGGAKGPPSYSGCKNRNAMHKSVERHALDFQRSKDLIAFGLKHRYICPWKSSLSSMLKESGESRREANTWQPDPGNYWVIG